MPPRSSRTSAAEAAPTRARSSRSSANKRVEVIPAQDDSDEPSTVADPSEEEEASSEEEVKPKGRGGKIIANVNKPTSRTTRDRTSTASGLSTASAAPKSNARAAKGKAPAKKNVVPVRRSTRASSVAASVNEEAEDEEEEEEEEVVQPKRRGAVARGKAILSPSPSVADEEEDEEETVQPKRRGARGRAILSPSPSVADEEEEDVKPIIKRGNKKVSIAAPPSPEPVEEEDEAELETVASEEESVDEEEARPAPSPAKPLKRTPTKPKSKRVILESPSASEADDDQEMLNPVEPVPAVEPVPVDVEMAAPPPVEHEEGPVVEPVEEEQFVPEVAPPIVEEPIPAPVPIVNLAPTAHDLASAARMAALNHAANAAQREKEREGKPRLVIHQMVLEDFKSYRGRGVIGPFHKSFSSIVGPNGSGKSNTIDALLFVFGYRASKMRQGKLSELIHNSGPASSSAPTNDENLEPLAPANGSDFDDDEMSSEEEVMTKKGRGKGKKGKAKKKVVVDESGLIGSCTVEVWFREIIDLPGKDAFTVVPNSQLIVARTAYRNNSSRYTINGKTSNFTEVTALLKARGIDLDHNRFLILQGEVESIAQMKPKGATEHDEGLLEYLEDIIGTAKYKSVISEAVVEVERLNELRGEKMNRVKLVEREKSALEGRKKEADVYLRDQNELVHNQSALFQVNMHHSNQNAEVYLQSVENATAALKEEVEAQSDTLKDAKLLQEGYDVLLSDTKDVEKATNEVTQHLAVLDRADVQLQEKRKHIASKMKKLVKTVGTDTHAQSEAQTWVRNHGDEIVKMRGSLDKMESNLEKEEIELEKIRDGLKGKTEVFSTQIESLQQDLQPWAEKISAKQGAIDLAANERDLLTEKTESVKIAVEEVQATIEKLTGDGNTKAALLDKLLAEKSQVEKDVHIAQKKFDGMQSDDVKIRSKASAARQKSDEAKSSQAANRSQNNVLSSLTKLKDQGRLPGFHGRLGNLGRIDDKYDVAISTACGSLDNLVVDTITGGQACIEHVRKNDLGRANVMCLDSITSRNMDRIDTPDNAPRLFDLITFKDQKFAPAFFQALSNTLVASDMEQANRIAFPKGPGARRWRVVTLDGKLIDTSGTMSGGGGRPAKGGMSSKITADDVSPEVVAQCEKEREVAVEELRVFSEERLRIEDVLGGLRRRLPEIEVAISKVEMDLKTGSKRMEEAEKRFADLKTQSKPEAGDLKLISQYEKDVKQSTLELDQLRQKSSTIEDQIKGLQDKILEVGGVKLRSQQTRVQDLKSQIDHSSDRLTKAEVGKAKSEKDAAKLEKAIEANKESLAACEEEAEELNQLDANGTKDSELVRRKVEEAQELLAEKTEELKEMKSRLDEQLEVMIQFKARELELKQTLKDQNKLLDDSKHAVAHWSQELGRLKLNDIDDDDEDEAAAAVVDENGDVPMKEQVLTLNSEIRQFTPDEIAEINVKVVKGKIAVLQERIGNMSLDLAVLKEYARREREFMERAADLDVVTKERDAAKKMYDDLRNQRLKEFMEGFGIISMKLKEMYQMITLGGNAELELVDSLDPFSEGIIFSVMPPKKSWKNISNLSGGEKTLSSLALVFALHVFKPTPLYFMDEIDAALDFRNVSIVANYIKDRTKNAQFIIISLRNNMFELSSRLIGIYKHDNATRSIAIDNADITAISSA